MIIRIGSCNQCGKCCMPPVVIENPCMEPGDDKCKFYTNDLNEEIYGHCLIHGRGDTPITSLKDRAGKRITQEQIDWFNRNCVEYPTVKDAEIGAYLPPECSFSFEVMTDA